MLSIKKIHTAGYSPIANLITYGALPTHTVDQIHPFLFLNHHGYQQYPPNNSGLPFGPHPHRGMETVTFILEGDILHKDSTGHESVIEAGGVQWMTAGKGLIHAEVSSEQFKKEGGDLEILQLWLNLPSALKMSEPKYIGLQKMDIPFHVLDNGNTILHAVSGNWFGLTGAFESLTNVALCTIFFKPQSKIDLPIPAGNNILFYVVRGKLSVNNTYAELHQLVEFNHDGDTLHIVAETSCVILLGYAQPLNEPVVAQGPFVMNTEEEVTQAYQDYREGKFGYWR